MNIIEKINDLWINPEKADPGIVRGISFYPSAAMSVDLENPTKNIGACMRAEYYRCKRYSRTEPTSLYSEWIMSFGKHLEVWLIERLKEAGIYAGSNMKFNYPAFPLISGEIDILVKEPDGSLSVIENKTYNGSLYQVQKKLGGSGGRSPTTPTPKLGHVMQSFIYLHSLSKISKVYLTYIDRSAGDPVNQLQFDITSKTEEGIGSFAHYEIQRPFGFYSETIKNFTFESILEGYRTLLKHLQDNKLPPKSYYLSMSPEEVADAHASGEVSKTKYENYLRNPERYPISSWNCSYCNYRSQCIKDSEEE